MVENPTNQRMVILNASDDSVRTLSGGRTALWEGASGTVAIHNSRAIDGGTVFRPTEGRPYFDGLK